MSDGPAHERRKDEDRQILQDLDLSRGQFNSRHSHPPRVAITSAEAISPQGGSGGAASASLGCA